MWWGRRRRRNHSEQKQRKKHRLFLPLLSIPFISSESKSSNHEPQKPQSSESNLSRSDHPIEEIHGSDESTRLEFDTDNAAVEDQFSSGIRGVPVRIKSRDPERDFKESMEEMIRANKIQRLEWRFDCEGVSESLV